MKTSFSSAALCLFCSLLAGCSGGAAPGQYKTRERPAAVLDPVEPGKDAKAAEKGKTTEKDPSSDKDKGTDKSQNSAKNPPAEKK